MKINILICNDNDEPLINETVASVEDAHHLINGFEYEYDARMDALTGGCDE